jgi:PII-like signaling protein
MKLPPEGKRLRIFIGESDRHDGKPLYEWLVIQAKAHGLAGATVIRGLMGYGAGSRIHTSKILRLSLDLPMVVEIVDTDEKVHGFLASIEDILQGGLVTIEKTEVRIYNSKK